MDLTLLEEGPVFVVYALSWTRGGSDYCPAREFIGSVSAASRRSLLGVLRHHAVTGPIPNTGKSRLLEDGIFEFKSRRGDRLLYFYHPWRRGVTIVTHGFRKGARLRTEIERAHTLRREYLQDLR